MKRRGRKRKLGRRKPSGDLLLLRERESPAARALQMPHRRRFGAAAVDQRAESELGRMRLVEAIAEEEYLAGVEYARIWRAYVSTLAGPHRAAIREVTGAFYDCGGCLGMVGTDFCLCELRKRKWLGVQRALRAAGWAALLEVQRVVVGEMECGQAAHLRLGLSTLASYLGLTKNPKGIVGNRSSQLTAPEHS